MNLWRSHFTKLNFFIALFILSIMQVYAAVANYNQTPSAISANPASVNISTGIGSFKCCGVTLGGAWIADTNYLISGGVPHPKRWTQNNLLIASMLLDTKQAFNWDGGLFGVEFLQFNGQVTNIDAGVIQGYNSLPGVPPLNRSELYQIWYRQEFFNHRLNVRVGKMVPTYDFNNVSRPVALSNEKIMIPTVSGLIFTPLFINPSTLGVLPGYYNSAYGVTINFAPIKQWYASFGIYDGNLANGVQTGIKVGPTLNGFYFKIAETGWLWLLGRDDKPGNFAIGAWTQDGRIKSIPTIQEDKASGAYLFGAQRLWYRNPGCDNSGISAFYQFGINNSTGLPIKKYVGAGFTAFGLVPCRPDDSMGFGTAYSWLNHQIFTRHTELMFQTYYQAKVFCSFYLEPAVSYIPTPGASSSLPPAWAVTLRAVLLF